MEKKMLSIGKVKIKAIIFGWLINLIGPILVNFIIGLICGIAFGRSPQMGIIQNTSTLIVGLVFGIVGGYVAGRTAKESELLHGGIVGALNIVMDFLSYSLVPGWLYFINLLVAIPAGMAGGYIAMKKH